ncbi:MAG: AraC family transcriptional regulator [Pseudomonadota bacterium]
MSTALAVYHGAFGRASLYKLDKPLATHAHREGHLVFQVDGRESVMHIADDPHPLTRHWATAVNPWQPHNFVPGDPINGSVFLVLYIKPIWFLEFGRSASSALRFGRNTIEVTGQVQRLVSLVTSLLLDDDNSDLFGGYLFELTRTCFEQTWQWVDTQNGPQSDWSRVRDYRIRNSIRLMKERIGDELALDTIARDAGLSRPHFYKLFRQNVGLTPNMYLNTLRMETSVDRLATTRASITEIGLDLGFASQASFTRFFASNVGIPPTDYRRATSLHA